MYLNKFTVMGALSPNAHQDLEAPICEIDVHICLPQFDRRQTHNLTHEMCLF